jgi:hypothetical protein
LSTFAREIPPLIGPRQIGGQSTAYVFHRRRHGPSNQSPTLSGNPAAGGCGASSGVGRKSGIRRYRAVERHGPSAGAVAAGPVGSCVRLHRVLGGGQRGGCAGCVALPNPLNGSGSSTQPSCELSVYSPLDRAFSLSRRRRRLFCESGGFSFSQSSNSASRAPASAV